MKSTDRHPERCSHRFHVYAVRTGSRDVTFVGITEDELERWKCNRCNVYLEVGVIERPVASGAVAK